MNAKIHQSPEQAISSYIGKLLRDNFGKGPESVFVSIKNVFITVYFRNFLSPIEQVLMEQNQQNIINHLRIKVFTSLIPEINLYIEMVTGNKIKEFYYDWSLHNKSGMFTCLCDNSFEDNDVYVENFYGKEGLEAEMIKLSYYAQRAPDKINSYELNSRTILVVREGIMVRLEKELVRRGHQDILRAVKKEMEKSYLHNNIDLEFILNKSIIDSFTAWDFQLDKSIFLFILNPDKQLNIPTVEMS